jgi:type IV pilus assembly protein PilY1
MDIMRRIGCIAVCLLAVMELARPARVAADVATEPDVRDLEPYFVLVVDTSGSMESRPDCACEEAYCEDCLPLCQKPAGPSLPPISQKNRWAVTLEALTGTFQDFKCTTLERTDPNTFKFDIDYYLPYNQPWSCASGTTCEYTAAAPGQVQLTNGILDEYADSVRFGLMTFDGIATYVGASEEVPVNSYLAHDTLAEGSQGLWSYGDPKTYAYPGCGEKFMMNTGVRSPTAEQGRMISLNTPGTTESIAADIQAELLKTRPFKGTPIAAALDDLKHHIDTEMGSDPYAACRDKYALLLTDGRPDGDFRPDCACNENGGTCPGDTPEQRNLPHCPYPKEWETANKLVRGEGATKGKLKRLFVVGMAVDDGGVRTLLDDLAKNGCTSATAPTCNAWFATDFTTLMSGLNAAISDVLPAVSRSVPAFALSRTRAAGVAQYMISAGFQKPALPGKPWSGVLERKRYTCTAQGALVEADLTTGDLFHNELAAQSDGPTRRLYTADLNDVDYDGRLQSTGQACDPGGCDMVQLKNLDEAAERFEVDETQVAPILKWMTGATGAPRSGQALGDIYHSSPVVLTAPTFDTVDEGFNMFRRDALVALRPVTIFVNSNDGILHAFSVEAYNQTIGTGAETETYTYEGGDEMWGFVPPLLIDNLKDNLVSHHITLDGTPVIKDVYFNRALGKVGSQAGDSKYHTVLITGMRGGGNAYIALDITNVHAPKFLWQFTDEYMGKTYGQAAIGQATWKLANGTYKHGAVAILPGGKGTEATLGCTDTNGKRPSMHVNGDPSGERTASIPAEVSLNKHQHRGEVRCWDTGPGDGRSLYFVDVETGESIKTIRDVVSGTQPFPSPMVGTPAIYPTDIGATASRAFMVDADGWVWRIDLSAPDHDPNEPLKGWTALPFHDMFHGGAHDEGEYSYEAPILSVDPEANVVVIVGTGDTDDFVKPDVKNRVASLTEVVPTPHSPLKPSDYMARLNWEMRVPDGPETPETLSKSELVTGSMALYQGTLFFGSFISAVSSDLCNRGRGRLHAVDYVAHHPTAQNTEGLPPHSYRPKVIDAGTISVGGANVLNVTKDQAPEDFLMMGMSIVQRPSCTTIDTETGTDMWQQSRAVIKQVQEPSVYLVSQASGNASEIAKRADSSLGTMELKLQRKPSYTRITSWATTVE